MARYQKLFEVRALVFAVAVGDVKRRVDQIVIAEDAHGGGVEVQPPRVDAKNGQSGLGESRKYLVGPGLEDLIHGPPQVVIAKAFGSHSGTQQQFGVLFFEELGQPVQRRSA